MTKLSRHHCYPKRHRNGNTEIKLVNDKEHKAWHLLVGDSHPINALSILANKFLPSDIAATLQREFIERGDKNGYDDRHYICDILREKKQKQTKLYEYGE